MIATLLVREFAPAKPSICLGSGLPKILKITASRILPAGGISCSLRNIPLLVPPRTIVQGTRNHSLCTVILSFRLNPLRRF